MESYQKYLINSIVWWIKRKTRTITFQIKERIEFLNFRSTALSYLLLEQLIKRHDSLSVEMT